MHQPLIPGCLIIRLTITQNAWHENPFHGVLCLERSERNGYKHEREAIKNIIELAKKRIPKVHDIVKRRNVIIESLDLILSILVDTFFTRLSMPKRQHPEIHSISVV